MSLTIRRDRVLQPQGDSQALKSKPRNANGVSDATLIALRGAASKALASKKIAWKPMAGGLPLGIRTLSVPLFSEKHPDGFSYTALIPVGVLAPGALTKDPNKVDSFYIQRTGGFAGLTQIAGPISRGKARS